MSYCNKIKSQFLPRPTSSQHSCHIFHTTGTQTYFLLFKHTRCVFIFWLLHPFSLTGMLLTENFFTAHSCKVLRLNVTSSMRSSLTTLLKQPHSPISIILSCPSPLLSSWHFLLFENFDIVGISSSLLQQDCQLQKEKKIILLVIK